MRAYREVGDWAGRLFLALTLLAALLDAGRPALAAGVAGAWSPLPAAGAPSPRSGQFAAWTGSEMLIWGGHDLYGALGDGAAYSSRTNTWRSISSVGAPFPRDDEVAVWTGKELLVWGRGYPGRGFADGAAYNPATDTWRQLATDGSPRLNYGEAPVVVWTGKELLLWYGLARIGGRYDPATDSWRSMSSIGAPSARTQATAVWTGSQMIVWGGSPVINYGNGWNAGAVYSLATDTWTPLATVGAPPLRIEHSAVWTGSEMLIWGGVVFGVGVVGDGAAYNPRTKTWRPIASDKAPIARTDQSAVRTGKEMLVWGGLGPESPELYRVGGAYDPATNTWRALPTAGAPSARIQATAVWTGSKLLIWGGEFDSVGLPQFFGNGAAYTPARAATASTTHSPPRAAPETGGGGAALPAALPRTGAGGMAWSVLKCAGSGGYARSATWPFACSPLR